MSLLSVLALVAGVAVAYKLFDQTVPNNVVRDASNFDFMIEVHRKDCPVISDPAAAEAWHQVGLVSNVQSAEPIFCAGYSQFPGDSVDYPVRIKNTNASPAKDASFQLYVDQPSIKVKGCDKPIQPDGCVEPLLADGTTNPAYATTPAESRVREIGNSTGTADSQKWQRFVGYWTLKVEKERVLTSSAVGDLNENDHNLPTTSPDDLKEHPQNDDGPTGDDYSPALSVACQGTLREITASSPCKLGKVKQAGSRELNNRNELQPVDVRYYKFTMSEQDDGTDQSAFKGWYITFTMNFTARVPAEPESNAPIAER